MLLFFRKVEKPGWRFPQATRDQGFGVKDRGLTREWRRKPLKSLKTDSEMAIRRLAIVGRRRRWRAPAPRR
jgi:hypothetical protein